MYTYSKSQRNPWTFQKYATAVLTPEAMQAAMQPPQDPAMQGGAPMQGAPMDPAMMQGMPPQGAPMPPQGAPMDPAMMQGGQPPMDPAMMQQGGAPMPPQGGGLPPEAMQDQLFLQFMAEAFGIMLDPRSGQFFDQNGQPVPPDMLMQAYQAYMQGMQQLQAQGGMSMDPNAAMGGQPPMDPAMMQQGGMPMDQGQPPMDMGGQPGGEQPMDPMMQELASLMATVMEDTIVTPMKETIASLQKEIADLKTMMKNVRDDMGTVKDDINSSEQSQDERDQEDRDEEARLRADLAAELQPTMEPEPEMKTASAVVEMRPLNIFDILGGN